MMPEQHRSGQLVFLRPNLPRMSVRSVALWQVSVDYCGCSVRPCERSPTQGHPERPCWDVSRCSAPAARSLPAQLFAAMHTENAARLSASRRSARPVRTVSCNDGDCIAKTWIDFFVFLWSINSYLKAFLQLTISQCSIAWKQLKVVSLSLFFFFSLAGGAFPCLPLVL